MTVTVTALRRCRSQSQSQSLLRSVVAGGRFRLDGLWGVQIGPFCLLISCLHVVHLKPEKQFVSLSKATTAKLNCRPCHVQVRFQFRFAQTRHFLHAQLVNLALMSIFVRIAGKIYIMKMANIA